ncbi:MAG TPA: vWA domain-containing protein, partial [Blastocatellia bacterium]
MSHFAILQASLKQSFKAAASRCWQHKLIFIRALMVALLVAAPLVAPRHQQAQDNCTPVQAEGCYVQAKRDIAFLIDATGSVEQRGQTYNIQVEGVRRAISDPTVIPRDGSVAVAVIVFNEAVQVFVPLTEVTSEAVAQQIAKAVDSLKCANIHSHQFPCPFGATLYVPAIQAADIHLSRARNQNPKPGVHRVIVLSSDGLPNDLGAALQQVEQARVAATEAAIPFELDFIVVGEDQQSPTYATALGTANEMVTPKPANDLPGETFVITTGSANLEGANPTDKDISRQANDFAETIRSIMRGQVTAIQSAVTTEADTAPGTPIAKGGSVSLRQAIEQANCNGGNANISFANGVNNKTFKLQSPLQITAPDLTISGCASDNCQQTITLDGGGQVSDGIVIRSNRVTIRGLRISNFTRAGVVIGASCPNDSVGHNRVEQNVIEGSPTGILVLGATNVQNRLSRNAISRPTPTTDAPATALIDLGGDGP